MRLLVVVLASLVFLFSCSKPAQVDTSVKPPDVISKPVSQAQKPMAEWEQKWEKTLAAAKKEGKVSVYAIWRPSTRDALGKAFREKFGITLEFTTFSRGGEILAKVQAEKRAGLYLVDVFGAGGPSLITAMKPAEVLGPLEPLFILPEVKDNKLWVDGQIPYQDKDRTAIGMLASIQRYLIYNTDLVKEGEITSYRDVLKPQFKGKITLNDPTVTGVGNTFISHVAYHIWSQDEAMDYLTRLIKEQDAVIQRDGRLHGESVAKGKFAIGLATNVDVIEDFLSVGAPIKVVIVKEGSFVTPASGALAVPTSFGNPNAARVFVNWILSKEGQEVFSRSFGSPSARADVSTEGLRQVFLPQSGEKLYWVSEELLLFQGKMLDIAKKTIDESTKK